MADNGKESGSGDEDKHVELRSAQRGRLQRLVTVRSNTITRHQEHADGNRRRQVQRARAPNAKNERISLPMAVCVMMKYIPSSQYIAFGKETRKSLDYESSVAPSFFARLLRFLRLGPSSATFDSF